MATRKEEKAARRAEREQREAEAAAAERRRRQLGYLVAGVLVLATLGVVIAVVASGGDGGGGKTVGNVSYPKVKLPPRSVGDVDKAAALAGCTLQAPPSAGRSHVTTPVTYKSNPPTSGNHNPVPAQDGAYADAPTPEHYVHTLEHGRIELQYAPNAPAQVRGAMKAIYDEDPNLVLLFPNNTGMRYQVAATSWGHLIGCPRYNDKVPDALRDFRDVYRDKAPEPSSVQPSVP